MPNALDTHPCVHAAYTGITADSVAEPHSLRRRVPGTPFEYVFVLGQPLT